MKEKISILILLLCLNFNTKAQTITGTPCIYISGEIDTLSNPALGTYTCDDVDGAASYDWIITDPNGEQEGPQNSDARTYTGSFETFGGNIVSVSAYDSSNTFISQAHYGVGVMENISSVSGLTSISSTGMYGYSVTDVEGATSYSWTYPPGWSGSSTTNNITLTASGAAQSGNIKVIANATQGNCTMNYSELAVSVSLCLNTTITSSTMYNGSTWSSNVYSDISIGTGTSITATTNQVFKFSTNATITGPFSSGTGGNTVSIVPTPCP